MLPTKRQETTKYRHPSSYIPKANHSAQPSIINRRRGALNSFLTRTTAKFQRKRGPAIAGNRPATRSTGRSQRNQKEIPHPLAGRQNDQPLLAISRARAAGISQTLSCRFPLTMVFPFWRPTNVRSTVAPSIPADPGPRESFLGLPPEKGEPALVLLPVQGEDGKGRGYTEKEREFRTRLCSQVGSPRSGHRLPAG